MRLLAQTDHFGDLEDKESSGAFGDQEQAFIRVVKEADVLNGAVAFERERHRVAEREVVLRVDDEVAASIVDLKHDEEVGVEDLEFERGGGRDGESESATGSGSDHPENALHEDVDWKSALLFENHEERAFPAMDEHLLAGVERGIDESHVDDVNPGPGSSVFGLRNVSDFKLELRVEEVQVIGGVKSLVHSHSADTVSWVRSFESQDLLED